MSLVVRGRAEAAETQLEASVVEIRPHEAISSPSSWACLQIAEHEELRHEHMVLYAEVERLRREGATVEEHLETNRRNLFRDDGLRTSVAQLRCACDAAVMASQHGLRKPALLEAEVA